MDSVSYFKSNAWLVLAQRKLYVIIQAVHVPTFSSFCVKTITDHVHKRFLNTFYRSVASQQ